MVYSLSCSLHSNNPLYVYTPCCNLLINYLYVYAWLIACLVSVTAAAVVRGLLRRQRATIKCTPDDDRRSKSKEVSPIFFSFLSNRLKFQSEILQTYLVIL